MSDFDYALGYLRGVFEVLALLQEYDLLDVDTEDPCVRCGETTTDGVESKGMWFPMCEGCQ